ncbi:cell wall hydrolase [Roseiarcus fermentans]|uniref:Cell wall hydrolase n=2 Tax=Roseiarcus fermentans TaxID=1473586 RepID=A0A366EJR2_9HYPH|nr:cell wall hydrolase [Roseiarcus fermentans]
MGRSPLTWAASTVAPWCLAIGVLLSITAEAEQERAPYASAYGRAGSPAADSPLRRAIEAASRYQAVGVDGTPSPLIESRLVIGDPDDDGDPDEIEPNRALKDGSGALPDVDRRVKGNPFIGPRPGFDARRRSGPIAFDSFARGDASGRSPRAAEFDPDHTMSPPGSDTPAQPPGATASVSDGATPAVPLEFALNAESPTPTDGVVVEIQGDSVPAQTTIAAQSPLGGAKPDYAALIDPKDSARQMRCLAEAIYFESRSEPEAGQAAVAQVVLNRVRSGIYPTTVCSVVYQDRNRPFACQFSFACEGKSLRIEEPGPWATATRIADEVVSGRNYNADVAEAVNYHAAYVAPFWVGYLKRVDRIGLHIFYAMRDGVVWAPGALNGHGDRP